MACIFSAFQHFADALQRFEPLFPFVEAELLLVARVILEDLRYHDVQGLVDLVLRRDSNGLLELLELFKALELHRLHGEDRTRDVGLQILLGYL